MKNETKLLNCPFCREELEVVGKDHYLAHKTNGCILQHLCFESDDNEAIKAWNTRKPMERIIERLEDNKWERPRNSQQLSANYAIEDAIETVKEEGGKQMLQITEINGIPLYEENEDERKD